VCAALGVPHSLISADAANYATSQQDSLNFYQQTVVPQALLIEEVLNDQIFADAGLRWQFHPEQLEVFQAAEMQKAQAVARLVGRPIMTVDEGRAWMGLAPLHAHDEEMQAGKEVMPGSETIKRLEMLGLVNTRHEPLNRR
jgi:phage portal protein BeeE